MAVDAMADESAHVVHRKLGERAGIRATQIPRKQAITLVHGVVARGSREPHGTQLAEKDRVDLHAIQTRQQAIHPSTLLMGAGKVLALFAGHAGNLSFASINTGSRGFHARAATTITCDSRRPLVTILGGAHGSNLFLSHNSSPKLIRDSRASKPLSYRSFARTASGIHAAPVHAAYQSHCVKAILTPCCPDTARRACQTR